MEDLFPIFFCIIFALPGAFIAINHIKKRNLLSHEGEQVIATITSIRGRRKHRRAYIRYIFNNEEYETMLYYYSSSMRIGDDVELYINKDDPEDYVYAGNGPIELGVIFIVIGIVPLLFLQHT